MRYRKTPARRRGRRYRLASAFPRRRYLPAAAAVSFLSPPLSAVFFPSPSPAILSTLYLLTVRWILLSLPRPPHASSYNVVLRLLFIPPPPRPSTLPIHLPGPPPPPLPLPLFPIRRGNRCCSGPELVQNRWPRATSGKGLAGLPPPTSRSFPPLDPAKLHAYRYALCAHTRAREKGEEEVGGTEQKRNGDARKGREGGGMKEERGCEGERERDERKEEEKRWREREKELCTERRRKGRRRPGRGPTLLDDAALAVAPQPHPVRAM